MMVLSVELRNSSRLSLAVTTRPSLHRHDPRSVHPPARSRNDVPGESAGSTRQKIPTDRQLTSCVGQRRTGPSFEVSCVSRSDELNDTAPSVEPGSAAPYRPDGTIAFASYSGSSRTACEPSSPRFGQRFPVEAPSKGDPGPDPPSLRNVRVIRRDWRVRSVRSDSRCRIDRVAQRERQATRLGWGRQGIRPTDSFREPSTPFDITGHVFPHAGRLQPVELDGHTRRCAHATFTDPLGSRPDRCASRAPSRTQRATSALLPTTCACRTIITDGLPPGPPPARVRFVLSAGVT